MAVTKQSVRGAVSARLANNNSRRHGRHTKDIQLPPTRTSQRIAKLLARAGVASRREIERMIGEGRVAIDGKVVETPATLLESIHGVTVDGNPVKEAAPARLYRYHKPAGVLTAERDPKGRPTIYDRLPTGLPRLMPVGRLDMNTEGLLLLTTDGGLKRELELPATGVERVYRARTFGDISQEQLEKLFDGVEIEGIRYGPIDANLERRTGRNQWIELRLREGKNREVRRVLEHLGLKVSRLIRIAYGPFPLADLAPGAVDEIRQHVLVAFRRDLSAPGATGRPAAIATRPVANGTSRRSPPRGPSAAPKRDQRTGNRKQPTLEPGRDARTFSRGQPAPRPAGDDRRPDRRPPTRAPSSEDRNRAGKQPASSLERDERVSSPRPLARGDRRSPSPVDPRGGRPIRGRRPTPSNKKPGPKRGDDTPRPSGESSDPRRRGGTRPLSAKPARPGKNFKPHGPRGAKPPGPRRK